MDTELLEELKGGEKTAAVKETIIAWAEDVLRSALPASEKSTQVAADVITMITAILEACAEEQAANAVAVCEGLEVAAATGDEAKGRAAWLATLGRELKKNRLDGEADGNPRQ